VSAELLAKGASTSSRMPVATKRNGTNAASRKNAARTRISAVVSWSATSVADRRHGALQPEQRERDKSSPRPVRWS
jgi:hypothetical protein